WTRSRKQTRDEVRAVRGEFHHGFIEEMLEQVFSSDVDDEGHPGPDSRDVVKVLFRTYAQVHATGAGFALQLRDDQRKAAFVRQYIFRQKYSARFGQSCGQ